MAKNKRDNKNKPLLSKKDIFYGSAYGATGGLAGKKVGEMTGKQGRKVLKARALVSALLRYKKSRPAALKASLALEGAIKKHKFFRPYRMNRKKGMLIGSLLGAGIGVGSSKLDTLQKG